jgi:undecaprenyl-diphosphatase
MASQRNGVADWVAQFLNTFGGTLSMTLVTAAIVAMLLVAGKWRQAITIGLTVALASGICTVLKIVIARPRPLDGVVDVGLDSFPSGHTTTAAALTFAIALAFPQIWTWALAGVWVSSMALSRTYLLVHWSSDVLAAAVLGASVALLVAAILTAVFQDRSQSRDSLKKPSLVDPSFLGNERASTETLSL